MCLPLIYDRFSCYRANIKQQVEKEKDVIKPLTSLPEVVSGWNDDMDDDEIPSKSVEDYDSDLEENNDANNDPEHPEGKKQIEPLPRIDHSLITYPSFRRRFYSANAQTENTDNTLQLRNSLDISVSSTPAISVPSPVRSFSDLASCFNPQLLTEIQRLGFDSPTPIQAQALPIILSGYDMIGLAQTGSGKTFAYVWPILVHVLAQPQMNIGDGPIALVLAPTRELTTQIFTETKRFAKLFNIRIVAVYGGPGKHEMSRALQEDTPEIVIATPGRLIELIKGKSTNLKRVTIAVLDEADRMFELGFEYQMRSILQNIRPDRQLLMFSATMRQRIESFAREMLDANNHIRVSIGRIGQANADIKQQVLLFTTLEDKYSWLIGNIDSFLAEGKVLVFAGSKIDTEAMVQKLQAFLHQTRGLDIPIGCLHGDKDTTDRLKTIRMFVKNEIHVLIATDVAARGLDVKDIQTVINYDTPRNIETYVHRIGRTGRMNINGVTPGTAYTLLLPKESSFACDLVQNLRLSSQPVPEELTKLAMTDAKWHRISGHRGGGSASSKGGSGGGSRGGLGTANVGPAMTSAMMAGSSSGNNSSAGSAYAAQPRSSSSASASAATQPRLSAPPPVAARQSRFDRPAPPTSGPVLKGFVKASSSYSSVQTQSPPPPQQALQQQPVVEIHQARSEDSTAEAVAGRKRSRWDA